MNYRRHRKAARPVQNVIDRCEHLYQRLDIIHRGTRSATLTLQKEQIGTVMADLIAEQLAHVDVEVSAFSIRAVLLSCSTGIILSRLS